MKKKLLFAVALVLGCALNLGMLAVGKAQNAMPFMVWLTLIMPGFNGFLFTLWGSILELLKGKNEEF